MSVTGVGGRSQLAVQGLIDMRRQLDELQRQLGTGKKSDTYAGLGIERGLAVGLRSQLSGLDSYAQTITILGTRLDLAQTVLGRLSDIARDAKPLTQPDTIKASGQTASQETARSQLDELLNLLNTQAGDRYLFGGRSADRAPVESTDHVLNGDGARAGLKQVIAERAQADLGSSGLGRLAVMAAAGTLSLAEDAAGSPFGFKLVGASSDLTGATTSGPAGSPPQIAVAFAANPNAGETITFTLKLPDGSQETLKLTASTASPPAAGAFTIGANATATAANLQSALSAGLGQLARTSLKAASAIAASSDFFDIDSSNPPRRVAGPPFDTATALVSGTPANTVSWYTGDMAGDARMAAVARVDGSITVNYGLRANEQAIRTLVQNVATFAAASFVPNDVDAPANYAALTQRLRPALAGTDGTQKIDDIAADLANVQVMLKAAQERHQQTHSVLTGLLDQIEGVPTEQVAAEILALQTRLQASLQTTAKLYQMNLIDYL